MASALGPTLQGHRTLAFYHVCHLAVWIAVLEPRVSNCLRVSVGLLNSSQQGAAVTSMLDIMWEKSPGRCDRMLTFISWARRPVRREKDRTSVRERLRILISTALTYRFESWRLFVFPPGDKWRVPPADAEVYVFVWKKSVLVWRTFSLCVKRLRQHLNLSDLLILRSAWDPAVDLVLRDSKLETKSFGGLFSLHQTPAVQKQEDKANKTSSPSLVP